MTNLTPKEQYDRLNQHFHACVDLPEVQRQQYVSKVNISDPELGQELASLLAYHTAGLEPETPSSPPPVAAPKEGTRTPRRRKWASTPAFILIGGALCTLGVLAAQTWGLSRLETHLRGEACRDLKAVLDFRVSALRSWAAAQNARTQKALSDPELITHVEALLELSKVPEGMKERLLSSPAYKPAMNRMLQAPPELVNRGFVIISPAGADLCAETETIVGRVVTPSGASYVRRMVMGNWIVSRPYPDRAFALGLNPDRTHPVMFAGGPIRDASGQVIALGVFRFSPNRFYEFLAPTSTELLAFDEKNVLLNDLRETEVLQKLGILPDSHTAFVAQLLDPGVDLQSGPPPNQQTDTWPQTLMSRIAIKGIDGMDDSGHRDIRGQMVLAAWTWLPEWEMGMGAQIPLKRVLAPLGIVRTAFAVILAIPICLTLGLLVAARHVRLRRHSPADSQFGSYVLEGRIGKGGMADVFLARHATLKRPAAVKILSQLNPDAASVERFEREARLTSSLGHPNTIQVFDYGETPDGRLYFAMEYVNGLNLAQFLTLVGSLPVARAVYLLKQIAGSLEEAHQLGLLHRDLKPTNIMVGTKGGVGDLVKVLDFGIACSLADNTEEMTRTMALIGTPAFLAPERIRTPHLLDPRMDIYSFGAVAFHLLTGRTVFEGAGPMELIYQVMTAPRPSPSQLRGEPLPQPLEKLVLDCLSISPDSRPPSFHHVQEILKSFALPDSWSQNEARDWWNLNRDKVATFAKAAS